MTDGQPTQVTCRWCGETIPAGEARCPGCRRPAPNDELGPLGGTVPGQTVSGAGWPRVPLPPAPPARPREELPPVPARGQEPFGSWASIRQILRADKALGAVLVLMALSVLLDVLSGALLAALFAFAVLWGIVTFRYWGYLLAMFSAGLGLLGSAAPLLGRHHEGLVAAWLLASAAINAFVLWVLYTRRESFD
jgi:hypothetical protein